MKLTVLGSGTGTPHPTRRASGYWLETQSGTLMLDCSSSGIWRAAEYSLDWATLDAIWISHFHLDHVGGLAPFLAGTKHGLRGRTKPLHIFGPIGLRKLLDSFSSVRDYRLFEQPFPVELTEVEELEEFEILPGVFAVAKSTPHTDESLAINIRQGEKTFVYTADTGFSEAIAAFASRVDLLVMECSYLNNKPVEKHLELAEAIHIIRRASPKHTVLTHFYPAWDNIDFAHEVKKIDPNCNAIQAYDGLQIEI